MVRWARELSSRRKTVTLCLALMALQGVDFKPAIAQVVLPPKECLFERLARPGIRRICIRAETYPQDLCRAIERLSMENDLPPAFFARLIWRESRFRADAVSYKGAEGIAQFMPGTAKLRGLSNSFDVVQALDASSRYLGELRDRFGNLGFRRRRLQCRRRGLLRFLTNAGCRSKRATTSSPLPAIPSRHGRTTRRKRGRRPGSGPTFLSACIRLAVSRKLREPILVQASDWAPWAVQLAANFDPAIARRLMRQSVARLPEPLSSESAMIVRQQRVKPGMRPKYQARIGRDTRQEAIALCDAIRKAGVACAVVKN